MNNGVPISTYKEQNKAIGMFGGKFLPFHHGHLNCIYQAAKQVDILFVVVSYDDEWDKALCEGTNFKWVSHRVRERWLSEELRFHKNIRVLSNYERRSSDYMNDESVVQANIELLEKVGGRIDICFSSEPSYEEYFAKVQSQAKHVILDVARTKLPVSATKIRVNGVHKMWEYLPRSVRKDYVKRICICGIESTGKTTLAEKLSIEYCTDWVEEYGRIFYEKLGGCHDIMEHKDFLKIAMGHNHLIEGTAEKNSVVDAGVMFIDTDNIYTQFFLFEEFGFADTTIDSIIRTGSDEIDLYIFLEPSIPHELDGMRKEKSWEDKQRENELLKRMYQKWYKKDIHIINSPDDAKLIEQLINQTIFND